MAELFGFEFKKKAGKPELQSFAPPVDQDDGALEIAAGGAYGTYVDLDGTVRTEAELVSRYRQMSLIPECDSAVDEIVNEAISIEDPNLVTLNLDMLQISEKLKSVMRAEFKNCLNVISFNKFAYEIFRRWYIDGRLYYHVVIDDKKPAEGIKELRFIDPRKIRKVREVEKKRGTQSGAAGDLTISKVTNEYYLFNDKGFDDGSKHAPGRTGTSNASGLKIAKDSIVHVVSGLTDNNGKMVLSYLHKAIKTLNQLSTLEDALVIYRLSRAPERRIWYIDVGNLPKMKAEQYVRDIMVKHKNRLIYDASSGEVRDDRKFMTMLEDYWLPRREGGRGTEVTTLPGGQNLGQMDDVLYFQKKFLQSLNVPVSRLNSDALFSVGRATEITRDELKFSKFIVRLRSRFSHLFMEILKKQLILKGAFTLEDWKEISGLIKINFAKDNYFDELKTAEILEGRLNQAKGIADLAEKYYSHKWIRKNVLKQSEEDIDLQDSEIQQETDSQDPRWINPALDQVQQNRISLNQQQQEMQQPQQAEAAPAEDDERTESVRQAMMTIKQMENRGKENRSMQDQSAYKAAVQVVAKNPDIAKSLSGQ